MNPAEIHLFYEELVQELRRRGVVCAITSGLACVHYGVAETTKDCDLLCHWRSFDELLNLLAQTQVEGVPCRYRGNISPPLDARWHRGGWTSHFDWKVEPQAVTLDVFGHALRESSPWERELVGLFAGPQTVAEMKRTNRGKDWATLTALGVRMIEAGDARGWMHVFDADTLLALLQEHPCPPEYAARRPALQLGLAQDPHTPGALNAERLFWEELDRRRIRLLERHLHSYVPAVRQQRAGREFSLREDHELRIECATQHLPPNPIKDYGLQRYCDESKQALVQNGLVPASALIWLPEVAIYFNWLEQ